MALDIGTLVGRLELDPRAFQQGLGQAGQALEETASKSEKSAQRIKSSFTGALGAAMRQVEQLGADGRKAMDLLSGPPEQLAAVAKAAGITVGELREELSKAADAAKEAGQDIGKSLGEAADSGEKSTGKLKEAFGKLKGVAAGALAGLSIGSILSKGWDRLTGIENAEAKLKGLGNSASDVTSIMNNAMAAVKGTAFGMDEAATVAASAVAAGIKPGQDLERTLKLVADASAIAGSDLGEMGQIFNKVATSNKLQGDTIDQLNERGIPIIQLLGKVLGKTSDEVVDMASKGKIGFSDFQKAIETGMSGAAKAAGETTSGALQNLGAAASRLGATLLKDVFPLVQGAVTGASHALDGFGKVLGPTIDWLVKLPAPVKAAAAALTALAVLKMTGVFAAIQRGAGAVLSPLASMRMQLAANREVAAATGTRFSAMGSVMRSVGSSAKGLGSSLLGAVGGPGGLLLTGAIVAVTIGLQQMAQQNQINTRNVQQGADAQKTLVDALIETGGAIDENVRKQAYANLQNAQYGRDAKDLTTLAQNLGVSQRDLVDAQLGSADAAAKVSAAYQTQRAKLEALNPAGGLLASNQQKWAKDSLRVLDDQFAAYRPMIQSTAELTEAQKQQKEATAAAADATGKQASTTADAADEMTDAQKKAADLATVNAELADAAKSSSEQIHGAATAAVYKAESDQKAADAADRHKDAVQRAEDALKGAQDKLTPFAQASQDAADKQSNLAAAADRVSDAIDRQKGILPDLNKATFDVNATLDGMSQSMGLNTKEVINMSYALVKGTSNINLTEESGRKLYGVVGDLKTGMIDLGTATFDANVKTKGVKGAQDEAAKAMQGVRAEAITNLSKIPGMTDEMAGKILDSYGLIPKEISTKIGADDEQNKKKAADVKKRAAELDRVKSMSKADLDKRAFDTKVNEIRAAQMPTKVVYFTADLSQVYAAMARANNSVTANGYIVARSGINVHRAGGGEIDGPGPKGKDSVLALVAPGEHVLTDKEVDRLGGQGEVYRLRRQIMAGNLPKFAAGGALPSSRNLAGIADPSYSGRYGVTLDALGGLLGFVRDLQSSARDASKDAQDAMKDVKSARADQKQQAAEARNGRADAAKQLAQDRKDAKSKLSEDRADAAKRLAESKASARQRLSDAEKAHATSLKSAKTAAQRAAANDRLAKAQRTYDQSIAKSSEQYNAVVKKTGATYQKAMSEAGAAYNKSTQAISKETAAAKAKTAAAERAFNVENKAAAAAKAKAAAEARVYNSTSGMRTLLGQLASRWDTLSASLEVARGKLSDLQQDRSSLVSSIAGNITGSVGGITGHQEQRRTAADIIRGLQFDKNQIAGFGANIAKARSLGLSSSLLDQVASGGVNNSGTAAALAGATKAQIATINSLIAQTNTIAKNTGNVVAGATYDAQIKAMTTLINRQASILSGVGSIQSQIASALSRMSLTMKIDAQGIARLVATGNKELARR